MIPISPGISPERLLTRKTALIPFHSNVLTSSQIHRIEPRNYLQLHDVHPGRTEEIQDPQRKEFNEEFACEVIQRGDTEEWISGHENEVVE